MKTTAEMARESGLNPSGDEIQKLKHFATLIRRNERELCAQICEDHFASDGAWCAEQIRKQHGN